MSVDSMKGNGSVNVRHMRESVSFDRFRLCDFVFSLLLSFAIACGSRIHFKDIYSGYTENTIAPISLSCILLFFAFFVLSYLFLGIVRQHFDRIEGFFSSNKGKIFCSKWSIILVALCLLICWMPGILSLYPGVVLPDSLASISIGLGDKPMSNHHPVLFTLLVKLFIGFQSISINNRIFLFSLFQSVCLACTISYLLFWMANRGAGFAPLSISFCYFAFSPVFPIYAMNLQKDVLYSASLLVFSLVLYKTSLSRTFSVHSGLILLLVSLTTSYLRNNGIYVVFASLLLLLLFLLFFKLDTLKTVSLTVFVYVFASFLIINPMISRHSLPTESVESLGIPLQQLGRVVVLDGNLDSEDYAYLTSLLPREGFESYAPCKADSLKWHPDFDNAFLEEHTSEFIMVWARNLIPNFAHYLDAYALNTFGFWVPFVKSPFGFLDTRVHENDYGITRVDLFCELTGGNLPAYCLDNADFFGSGTLLWLVMFGFVLSVGRKTLPRIFLFAPSFLSFATIMIATPVAFSLRYVFIFALGLPLFLFSNPTSIKHDYSVANRRAM